eukprot:3657834-Prymnesium_polylepis.3
MVESVDGDADVSDNLAAWHGLYEPDVANVSLRRNLDPSPVANRRVGRLQVRLSVPPGPTRLRAWQDLRVANGMHRDAHGPTRRVAAFLKLEHPLVSLVDLSLFLVRLLSLDDVTDGLLANARGHNLQPFIVRDELADLDAKPRAFRVHVGLVFFCRCLSLSLGLETGVRLAAVTIL